MKLYKLNNNYPILTPLDRPFYMVDGIELVINPDDADYILMSPEPHLYKQQVNMFSKYSDKCVVWVNNDNPDFLDDTDGVRYKFIAQPSGKKMKYTTVPLLMTDHYVWHRDYTLINTLRSQTKTKSYCFMGQIYGKRCKLQNIKLDDYHIRQTGSIYGMDEKSKNLSISSFLTELGQFRFTFAPRGTGSNSFRLYESLMVGTVPIVTDVIEFPFEDEVDWDSFVIRGSMDNIDELIEKSKDIDYDSFRKKGMEFFDEMVRMDKLYNKIVKKING